MKILQLGKFYPIKGGVEKVMYDIVKYLSEKGFSCDMLCTSFEKKNNFEKVILNKNAKIFICPTITTFLKTKISPQLIFKLRKIVNTYDIVHIHHPDPMVAFALFFSNYKGKLIVHWHSDILNQKKMLFFYKPLQKWLLRKADLILTTSTIYASCSNDLLAYLTKTVTLPIGIEDKSAIVNNEICTMIRKKYQNKKIIFSLGRFVQYKGFEYLIEAATYLPKDYLVLIGGDGPLKNEMRKKAEYFKVTKNVIFLDMLSDEEVLAYFNTCAVFCLPSIEKTEAFGIVQLEAMTFSKPIVSTNISGSGVPWVNRNGFTGITVPPKDSKALASAIVEILTNEETYNYYSENSRKRYETNFTIEMIIKNLLQIYNDLLYLK